MIFWMPVVWCGPVAADGPMDPPGASARVPYFSPPLIAKSPSPDTKVRLDYFYENLAHGEGNRHTVRFEGEYAFAPWLSFETNVPYVFLDPEEGSRADRLDNIDVALKYANFAFKAQNCVVGGGLELGLPTGNEERGIGSDHEVEIEPFLDVGCWVDRWEVIGFVSFGIPANRNGDDEADWELGWNLAAIYPVLPTVQVVLEVDGEHGFGGGEATQTDVVNATPGIKVRPCAACDLWVGMGVRLPVTEEKEIHAMPIVSLFYHF